MRRGKTWFRVALTAGALWVAFAFVDPTGWPVTSGHIPGRAVTADVALSALRVALGRNAFAPNPRSIGRPQVVLKLRDAAPEAGDRSPVKLDAGAPLDSNRISALLRRLPEIVLESDDASPFAMRAETKPPLLAGNEVALPFPAPRLEVPAPLPTEGPLRVTRHAPVGAVPMAANLSISFSEPMIAVGSVQDALLGNVVELAPKPPGRWRWIGTQTLIFEPAVRFPAATTYRVVVPGGTRAASGNTLEEQVAFEFETPPVRLIAQHPTRDAVDLVPLIFMGFDQRIEPETILDFVRLVDRGDKKDRKDRRLRIATRDEIERDPVVARLVENAEPQRWVALVPKAPLEPGRQFQVVLDEGAPSAEGPRTTERAQPFEFSTYDKLAIEDYACRGEGPCRPSGSWWLRFNNPLDQEQEIAIKIEPALAQQEVEIRGQNISITGQMQAKTHYRFVIPGELRDAFGQTLGEPVEISIRTGPASRSLHGQTGPLVTIDPFGPAILPVYSTNNKELSLRISRVEPTDWSAFNEWNEKWVREDEFSGREVVRDSRLEVDDENRTISVDIDLRPHLESGAGHFVVWIETSDRQTARKLLLDSATTHETRDKRDNQRRWARLPGSELVYWIQVTQLGLTAMNDGTSLVSWVTSLRDGSPVAAANVSLDPPIAAAALTNTSGIAHQTLVRSDDNHPVLIARKGRDSALLAGYYTQYLDVRNARSNPLLWYQFSDRGVYRPGESVRVKGWLRDYDPRSDRGLSAPDREIDRIDWSLQDPRGEAIDDGRAVVSALGGFDFVAAIPSESELGNATISLVAVKHGEPIEESRTYHSVMIQEFRRPEFEVTTQFEKPEHMLGDTAVVSLAARYFAGGGLSMTPVTWDVSVEYGSFVPPHHTAFQFGHWTPWWGDVSRYEPALTSVSHTATTDATGEHRLAIELVSVEEARPVVVNAQASVQDRNRQSWSSSSRTLVHPAELYVGMKATRTFVQEAEPFEVESVVVNLAGERVSGTEVKLRVEEAESFYRSVGVKKASVKNVAECATTSTNEPSSCRFEIERGGSYRVVASIEDAFGRTNESELGFWVAGGSAPIARNLDRERVELIPDRKEYQPGETAEILLQAPFFPAEGLVILGHNGIAGSETFRLTKSTHTLHIPIREEHLTGLNVAVELVGQSVGDESDLQSAHARVAFAGGEIELSVPPHSRSLDVRAQARLETLAPGGETQIEIYVANADGDSIEGAEVALVVVDESVLALTGYQLGDPLDVFYPKSSSGYAIQHQRSQISVVASTDSEELQPEVMRAFKSRATTGFDASESMIAMAAGAGSADSASSPPIDLRSDFSALALFSPTITTDANGHALVPLELPDSVTRYRIMAVAVSGDRFFGTGESQITARLPLMVRPSPPRFLNFGDRVELPVILQNQTDEVLDVEVAMRASNATFAGTDSTLPSAGSKVRVPANDRVEVRFTATATNAGIARFQVAATSGAVSDAASFDFPVWTPATSEASATYGAIDDGAIAQPIAVPQDAWPQFGGLEITTSSTQLHALTDAMLYLNTYEFECSEQIASRMLSVIALKDVLDAFEVSGMPEAKALEDRLSEDLEALASMQNADGGFGFWHQGERSWPYLTIHVAHAIARANADRETAKFRGFRALTNYIANIDAHIPPETSVRAANALRAYAFYVRNLHGDADRERARELARSADLSIESLAWLLPLLKTETPNPDFDAALARLTNQVTETAAGAHFVTSYTDGDYVLLHSDRRADGVVLGALVATDAQSDLVPKLVRGLLDHRKRGRWSNTQENVFILLALADYFERFEGETPDFVARTWLGDAYAGEHRFKGRSTDRVQLFVPIAQLLAQNTPTPLTLQKLGAGRLYYRVGFRYAPKSLESEAEDFGFAVGREYEAVDDPADVSKREDGTWHIKAGARVRVTLTLMNSMRRYHVALVDPLPAGLEAINAALSTSERLPVDEDRQGTWWGYGHWTEHENLRDERVEAFTSSLGEGVHTYRYFARATTPGEFVVPPTRAEEMYHPETFGRSASLRLIVE